MRQRMRKKAGASLSLEAAVSLPLFLLFMMAIISFLMILGLQVRIQAAMEETARSIGKKAYLLEQAGAPEEELEGLMNAGINSATVKAFLFTAPGLTDALNRSRIIGGAGGLYTHATTYDAGSSILDIVVSYDYSVPWLPGYFSTLRMVQRMRCHVWVGEPLDREASRSADTDAASVYVTPTGSVYHLSPDCHYLDLSIRSVSYIEVDGMRNADGAKYYRCEECASSGHPASVYITSYGDTWHESLTCSKLKRTVMEKDLSEVGDMRVCTKCQQEAQHSH